MSRRSIALPSSQQPLLQVQSQSKSNSSQSYTLFKYRFAASSVLPSPRLINVSSCHFAAFMFCPPHVSLTSARVTLIARLPSRFIVGGMHPPGVSLVSRSPAAGVVSCYTSSERCRCCWLSGDWLSSVMVPSRPTTTTLSR